MRRESFFGALVGDGRPLLIATGAALVFAGGFAVFLAAARDFLPHDTEYLGMTADQLCALHSCRVVDFMIHDRAAFGGALAAIGVLYVWLAIFPLRAGESWAWWTLLISGAIGFLTFLSYLGYGYLDTWHGLGTLILFPVFVVGMVVSRRGLRDGRGPGALLGGRGIDLRSAAGLGHAVLLAGALGTAAGGLGILWVGLTDIFVPQDLSFMQVSTHDLDAVSDRLVPLIAHDRAGFGGAVFVTGLTSTLCLWCAGLPRHLWEALLVAGAVSLSAALGVHFVVGYTDTFHLLPAVAAAASLVVGLGLSAPATFGGSREPGVAQPVP